MASDPEVVAAIKRLTDRLGDDTMEGLVKYIEAVQAPVLARLDRLEESIREVRGDLRQLRTEVREDLRQFRAEIRQDVRGFWWLIWVQVATIGLGVLSYIVKSFAS